MVSDVIGVVTASVGVTLLVVGACWALVKLARAVLREYREGKAIAKGMVATNTSLLQVANKVALELSMLRSIFTANQGGTPDPSDQAQYRPAPRIPAVPFPSAPPGMFPREPEPEAKEEDTEVVDTPDAELRELEEI